VPETVAFLAERTPLPDSAFTAGFPGECETVVLALRETIARKCGIPRAKLYPDDRCETVVGLMNIVDPWGLHFDQVGFLLDLESILRHEHGIDCKLTSVELPWLGADEQGFLGKLLCPNPPPVPTTVLEWMHSAVPLIMSTLSAQGNRRE